jgi:hypothetical protein
MLEMTAGTCAASARRLGHMHRIVLEDFEKYKRAWGVLIEVGGPFAGEGEDALIVSDEQYQALVEAKVVSPDKTKCTRGARSGEPTIEEIRGMHRLELKDFDTYVKAVGVLTRVGGPFSGRGKDVLIVTDEQYEAMVEAKVIPANNKKARDRGKKARK